MRWRWVLAGGVVLALVGMWLWGGGMSPPAPGAASGASTLDAGSGDVGRAQSNATAPLTLEVEALLDAVATDPERVLAAAVALLGSGEAEARLLGIHLLHGWPEPRALDVLGRALQDSDGALRWAAFRVVTDMAVRGNEVPEITALLEQALSDPDPALRSEAVDALAQRGAEGLRGMEWALADPTEDVRERAAALWIPEGD